MTAIYVTVLSIFLILILGTSLSYLLYSSHQGLCELTLSKSESALSPIARELILENKEMAERIFNQFKNQMNNETVSQSLVLSYDLKRDSALAICMPSVFSSSFLIPVAFNGKTLATIQGSASYLSWRSILALAMILIVFITASIQFFSISILKKILTFIIDPIRKISAGFHLNEAEKLNCVSEIIEIDTSIFSLSEGIRKSEAARLQLKAKEDLAHLSMEVAHDIRSPLAALEIVSNDLTDVSEEKRLILRSALGRIKDIANELLSRNHSLTQDDWKFNATTPVTPRPQLLSAIVDELITEKRMQFRSHLGVEITHELGPLGYGLFTTIPPYSLKRVLSNLINNSVEALDSGGKVRISLDANQTHAQLSIQDNGRGIPADILPKLLQRGETRNKEGGSGLGLYLAHSSCEAWGGTLRLESEVGQGTSVTLTLLRASPPQWFVSKIILPPQSTVIILDDDPSIHYIWQGRFDKAKAHENNIRILHFSTPQEMLTHPSDNGPTLLLCDYELIGQDKNGLSVIEELKTNKGPQDRAILVTSHYEEDPIQETCARLGVKIIPKGLAGYVPIQIEGLPDAILIDDDPIVHLSWKFAAHQSGHHFLGFKSADEFFSRAQEFDFRIPIYIDSNLGKNSSGVEVRGEEVSLEISKMGFQEIYLATGFAKSESRTLSWLKGIREKEPPFLEPSFKKGHR